LTQLTLKSGAKLVSAILENKEAYGFYGNARDILNKLPETEVIKRRKIEVLLVMTATHYFFEISC